MSNYRIKIEDGIDKVSAFKHITDIIAEGLTIRNGVKRYRNRSVPNTIEIISTSTMIDAEITYVFHVVKSLEEYDRTG